MLRASRRLLGYYMPFHNDESMHKLQTFNTHQLPDKFLTIERGTYVEPTTRLCVNTDGSLDLRHYELYPLDGPEVVLTPAGCDKMSWNKDVKRRMAILSGIDVDLLG